jgi:hypothetical protein
MTTLVHATRLFNISIALQEGRLSCQAQLYRSASGSGYVAILCVDPNDGRSLWQVESLAAGAFRYYRGLPADPVDISWILYIPSREAPHPCEGVHCPEVWEALRLDWDPQGGTCINRRKPLDRPVLLTREAVETQIGGAL